MFFESVVLATNSLFVFKACVNLLHTAVVSSLSYLYLYNEYYLWVGSLYLGKTFLVPLVVVIMLLSVVGPLGRQKFLCRDCGKYFLGDATYHSKKLREEALKMLMV